jgi:hypothetical protein
MKLLEVTAYNLKSQEILNESWTTLTESQRMYVSRWEKELWPLLEQYTKLCEAALTPAQIQQIFQSAEDTAMASGDNTSTLGKVGAGAVAAAKLPVELAKQVNAKIDELGRLAQKAGPVKAMDQKFDQLKNTINKKFPDSKILDGISEIGIWAKENPGKTLDEIRKIVSKNLAKDGQYYMKNAAFGVKGLGYKQEEMMEVSGKHKSSGYSDKLKKLVKESLSAPSEFDGTGLIVVGKTQIDNNLISDMLDETDFNGVWNTREGYYFFPESEETIDALEMELEKEFGQRGINARFEGQFNENLNEEEKEVKTPSPSKGKSTKPKSLDSELSEIDTQAGVVAMEAKLDKIDSMIQEKLQRLTMIDEDINLSELVDKSKIKSMQKEIKILEKMKAKMGKVYEKMTGKAYTKEEIVDESESTDE